MEFQWKAFPTILLLISLKSFVKLGCSPLPDVTYKDIEDLNATCKGLDSCELPRRENVIEHCNCGVSCNLLGTCCVDSKYRNKYIEPLTNIECQNFIYGKKIRSLPMINNCDPNVLYDETTEELCNSSGEKLNDPFLKIPVTDPITGISYKNHYCFACNRNNGEEKPVPWNLKLKSDCIHQKLKNSSIPKLHSDGKAWFITLEQEIAIEVSFHTSIPEELKISVPHCYSIVWSDCASYWTGDEDIKKKCHSYMALARILSSDGTFYIEYRNPHCAICNYHSIDDMECLQTDTSYDNDDNDDDENDGDSNDGDDSDGGEGDENDGDEGDENDGDEGDENDGNGDEVDGNDDDEDESGNNEGDEDTGGDETKGGENDENYENGYNDGDENNGEEYNDNKGDGNEYDGEEGNNDDENSLKDGIFFVKLSTLQNDTDCKDSMVYDYFTEKCRKIKKTQWRNKFG